MLIQVEINSSFSLPGWSRLDEDGSYSAKNLTKQRNLFHKRVHNNGCLREYANQREACIEARIIGDDQI